MIVDCGIYHDGVRRDGVVELDSALEQARDLAGGFVWIGLHEPTGAEFEAVAREFELHPLAVEDAIHAHQRPKLEVYGDTLFLVLKTARYVDSQEVVEIGQLMLFLGPRFVVSVRHGPGSPLPEVRQQLEADPARLRHGVAAVLHAVLDRVVDDYAVALRGLDDDVDQVEAEVFSPSRSNHAERIYKLKREVSELRRAVLPLGEPLARLVAGSVGDLDPEKRAYFRDVHDHVLRDSEHIEQLDGLLGAALSAHLAQVGVRQNEDVRKISAWVAILAVPTMIAGIYGMNFDHMPELGWRFGYPLVVGVMVTICTLLYRAFRRSGWL